MDGLDVGLEVAPPGRAVAALGALLVLDLVVDGLDVSPELTGSGRNEVALETL